MVEIADIVDRKSLEAWLQDQPKEVSVWIARRAAMRVLPIYWEWTVTSKAARKGDLTALPFLRFFLISGIARKMPTSEIIAANAGVAAKAADSSTLAAKAAEAATLVFGAADAATLAFRGADSFNHATLATLATLAANASADSAVLAADAAAVWASIRADCIAMAEGDDLDGLELWAKRENPVANVWGQVKVKLPVASASHSPDTSPGAVAVDWSFWIKWYDSVLAGEPLNWDMLEEIALIAPEEWEKGPARVNYLVGEIEQKYARAATPYPETLIYDGEYHVTPLSALPARSLNDARDRIADVAQDMRKGGNQYSALGDEADVLEDVLARYPDRAIRLFEVCHKVVGHVARHVENGVLPEGDNLIADVLNDLQNSADDIYNFDADVRAAVDARAKLRFERLDQGQQDAALALAKAVAQNSDDDLAKEMRADVAEVMAADDPEGESKPARYRLGSRLVRVLALGGAGVGAVLGTLATVEPATSGAQYLWQIVRPLIGF